MGFLKNMRLSRKLLLICGIFSLPIAWLLWLGADQMPVRCSIKRAVEVEGMAYIRPLAAINPLAAERTSFAVTSEVAGGPCRDGIRTRCRRDGHRRDVASGDRG